MERHVNVELTDGSICEMAKISFNVFLSLDKVARFKRANGWVVIGRDEMRDPEKVNDYPPSADRRATS